MRQIYQIETTKIHDTIFAKYGVKQNALKHASKAYNLNEDLDVKAVEIGLQQVMMRRE